MLRHSIPRNDNRVFAFTLAEVLITLVIIGVIAALTIPNLLTKYEKQQTISGLKKSYSVLQNAVKMSTQDNGPISDWDYTLNTTNFVNKYLLPYLKVNKKYDGNNILYKTVNPNLTYTLNSPFWILSDGSFIKYGNWNAYFIIVDINGLKGPNKVGRDLFAFSLRPSINRLTTYSSQGEPNRYYTHNNGGTSGQCNENAGGGWAIGPGSYCSRLIELDGWQIKDDYPW